MNKEDVTKRRIAPRFIFEMGWNTLVGYAILFIFKGKPIKPVIV